MIWMVSLHVYRVDKMMTVQSFSLSWGIWTLGSQLVTGSAGPHVDSLSLSISRVKNDGSERLDIARE